MNTKALILLPWTLVWITLSVVCARMGEAVAVALAAALSVLLLRPKPRRILVALIPLLCLTAPIMLIHSVLNPQFPITGRLLGFIPFRLGGATYSAMLSLRLTILFLSMCLWFAAAPSDVLATAVTLRLPTPIVLLIAIAASMILSIRRRIENVILAQESRGMRTSGSLVHRFRSLARLVLPVAVNTIAEAHDRGNHLEMSGFEKARLRNVIDAPKLSAPEIALLLFGCLFPVGCLWAVRVWTST